MKRTRYGGSEALPRTPTDADPRSIVAQSKLEEDPRLKILWAGYAFSVDFRVEYHFAGPEKRLTFSWDKGMRADQILAYYDEVGFKDWQHAETGAPVLKAQHPEFEMWSPPPSGGRAPAPRPRPRLQRSNPPTGVDDRRRPSTTGCAEGWFRPRGR